MQGLHAGFYWIPDERDVWTVGRFVSSDAKNSKFVKPDGKEVHKAGARDAFEHVLADQLEGKSNICEVQRVTKASLLHTVRTRYYRDEIYTNVARIVIAVNPFRALPIYGSRFIDQYAKDEPENLPPHVYGVAAEALRNIRQDNYKSQAILISGESGAGKTESTKLVLSFVADALRGNEPTETISIEEKVLMTSPVLEAFGNAKTARNNNSSRFGKWLEIAFSKDYGLGLTRISGARIKDYLLEEPRVTKIARNERNYHIFYHLFHHYGNEFGVVENFNYLLDGAVMENSSANCSEEDYREMRRAMTSLGFSEQEQLQIFDVVAALLHIGNLLFIPSPEPGSEGSVIEESESLEEAARLLGVQPEVLERSMVERQIWVGQERTVVLRPPAKAASARDALARLIYGYLFKWLVHKMNMILGLEGKPAPPPGQPSAFLGVLDIAGFESFEENSLEQLFINLSNEQLQHYFNKRVFMEETTEYEEEGIPVGTIDFSAVDNSAVVQLITGTNGLLPTLNDEVGLPNSTTMSYISKVKKSQAGSVRFVASKFSSSNFRVVHFAGQVEYNANQWLEKNDDNPPKESIDLLQCSQLQVIEGMLDQVKREAESDIPKVRNRAIIRKKTVATKFVRSLQALMAKVRICTPHFIRCIKPNHMKKPQIFDAPMVMEQLNFSGVLEAITIRQMGYPLRMTFAEFSLRYAAVVPLKERAALRKEFNSPKLETLDALQALLAAVHVVLGEKSSELDFAVGKKKIFIKGLSLILLEENRRHIFTEAAHILTCWSRGTVLRMRLKRHLQLAGQIQWLVDTIPQSPCETVDMVEIYQKDLEQLLSEVPEKVTFVGFGQCPNFPTSPLIQKTLQAAKVLVRKLGHQTDTWRKLADSNLISSFDVMEMTKMLVRANDLELTTHPPCFEMIKALEKRSTQLKKELPLLHALQWALDGNNGNLDQWKALLRMIDEAKMVESSWLNENGYGMTEELREMVKQEIENEAARRNTVSSYSDEVEGVKARRRNEDIVYEATGGARELLLCELEKAIECLDSSALETLLGDAMLMGLTSDKEFTEATQIFEALQSEEYPLSVLREELAMKDAPRTQVQMRRLFNLKGRLQQLGCNQEAREAAQLMQCSALAKHSENTVFDKVDEMELALVAFEDIRNFPRILDPKEKLRWSNEKITRPLTDMPQRFQRDAVWMFSDILGWMKDRRAEKATHQALAYDIVTVALKDQYLTDEAYIQVIKQLNDNPSEWSEHWGWKLMLLLCIEVRPCDDLVEFIRCVLKKKVSPAHYGIQKLCLNEINSRLRKRQTDGFSARECQIVVHLMNGESVGIAGTYSTVVDTIKVEACRHFGLSRNEYALFFTGNHSLWRLLPDHEPIRSFIDQKITLRQLSLHREEVPEGLHGKLSLLQARQYLLFGSDDERIACKSLDDVPPRMKHRASIKQLSEASEYVELQKNHWFGCLTWPAVVVIPTEEDAIPMPHAAHITSFNMKRVWVAANYEGVGFIPVGTSSQRDSNTWFTYDEHVLRWGAKKDIFQIVVRTPSKKCVSMFVKSSLALEIAYGLTRVCTAKNCEIEGDRLDPMKCII